MEYTSAVNKIGEVCRILQFVARHIRYRPCPVTSRIKPRASIQARLRWTAARLVPVMVSAIGADTSGHSVSTVRKAGGVLPESGVISVSARADHASISSRCRIAVRQAVSIPPSYRVALKSDNIACP